MIQLMNFTILIDILIINLIFSVFGMDTIKKNNFTGTHIPKYNNKVQNPDMFDKDTKIFVPPGALRAKSVAGELGMTDYVDWNVVQNLFFHTFKWYLQTLY